MIMGSKTLPIVSFTIIIIISHVSGSALGHFNREFIDQPFGFVKRLEGFHMGERNKKIHELRHYLGQFGYMEEKGALSLESNNFDDDLESAIRTYQLNYRLEPTGTLDSETVDTMLKPRCGVPDIINGTNRMQNGNISPSSSPSPSPSPSSSSFHTVSHYAFFPGTPKWEASKYNLTYEFGPQTPPIAIEVISKAFQTWAENSHFTFERGNDITTADIKIRFRKRDHGDGIPFDGRGGILAHAYSPQDGRFHFDAEENWVSGAKEGAYDLGTVALHEIGHLLGLEHSSVEEAIMYPTIPSGATKGLNKDDIDGIQALYKA